MIGAAMLIPAIIFGALELYIPALRAAMSNDAASIIMKVYLLMCVAFLTAPFEAGKSKARFIVKITIIVIAALVISGLVWKIFIRLFIPDHFFHK